MGFYGLLDLPVWQLVLIALALTHITIVSTTVYLHRHSAHNAVDLHPALAHFFRFWLWLTTATVTKEWTAIHRKHHATCETEDDPHSPVIKGIRKVLFEGAELYAEAATEETCARYGQRTPEDWIERNLYTPRSTWGVILMAAIDLALFGVHGIWIWAIQMMWIPVWAAGVVNGIGHYWGYRNYECADNARNIFPIGILIGGEELHNNHHTFPNSPKLSRRWWELDIGWAWIRLFQLFGLARPKSINPIAHQIPGKHEVDLETVQAIANARFQVLRQYHRQVLFPVLRQHRERLSGEGRQLYNRARKLLTREASLIAPEERERLDNLLRDNAAIRTIYEKSHELQLIWQRRAGLRPQDRMQALVEWCRQAEQSGIRYLEEFAAQLRSYSLRPA